jgi:hypothetical protein
VGLLDLGPQKVDEHRVRLFMAEPGAGYTCDVGGEYTVPAAKK